MIHRNQRQYLKGNIDDVIEFTFLPWHLELFSYLAHLHYIEVSHFRRYCIIFVYIFANPLSNIRCLLMNRQKIIEFLATLQVSWFHNLWIRKIAVILNHNCMLQVEVILGRNGAAISLLFNFVKIMLRVIYSEVRCYFYCI